MDISDEFSKVRFAFSKVKTEMDKLTEKISVNYDDFMHHHKKLSEEVIEISSKLKFVLEKLNEEKTHTRVKSNPKELSSIKQELKLLKDEVMKSHKKHTDITSILEEVRKNKKDIKGLKDKLKSSELELYLLKEKLSEKDTEIKQIKEISKHLFNVVEDLSRTEIALMNNTKMR